MCIFLIFDTIYYGDILVVHVCVFKSVCHLCVFEQYSWMYIKILSVHNMLLALYRSI